MQQAYIVVLSNYMEKKEERRLRDNLHIKGAVRGTFEDQTGSRALQRTTKQGSR